MKYVARLFLGQPSPNNLYLFNGDIVDKGQCSIECILLLLMYKLTYPDYVFINRGNHESAIVNVRHGFQKEVSTDLSIWDFEAFVKIVICFIWKCV